ncbi:predicted protein [Plenodomus lingam JN3]|uniref:Predicted protein n=1 Tax=Leptosphaeria maculans (strain JN3 / isolate v23.1.3 / race Av1-4-5-6-7-8) TaxID=985895 RepID=E5A2F2_LEPMJ|nr:predicted protein [Plenodomus lingam JN3]CBX97587.1 predicted protein [Plenodomus lingam JN3]
MRGQRAPGARLLGNAGLGTRGCWELGWWVGLDWSVLDKYCQYLCWKYLAC